MAAQSARRLIVENGLTKSEKIAISLDEIGMEILGGYECEEENRHCLVVASGGRAMWEVFRLSNEYKDGERDPLERWSEKQLGLIARQFDAELRLPFERPFAPFQQWAKRASGLQSSPLGLLIHPKYGLWFGLRGALFFPVNVENQVLNTLNQEANLERNICEACVMKPCLSTCPVSAFSNGGLDVKACFSHIDSSGEPDCLNLGCGARAACPVGAAHSYKRKQVQFHMDSYCRQM